MAIALRPEHEELVAEALRTGAYRDADDVLSQALERLHSDDEWLRRKDEINEKIERGLAQFERGEFYTAEESKADLDRRKAEWLKAQDRQAN